MSLAVFDFDGNRVGEEQVPSVLSVEKVNEHLIWEVVVAEQANKRQGTHKTKEKGEISGGGSKPFRQKGTGRARAGSNRSPIWRGGGITFGPRPRSYRQALSRKKKFAGIKNILSKKIQSNQVVVLDSIQLEGPSTKQAFSGISSVVAAAAFAEAYANNRKLRNNTNDKRRTIALIVSENDRNQKLSFKNIPWVNVLHYDRLAALPLYHNHGVIITKAALPEVAKKVQS